MVSMGVVSPDESETLSHLVEQFGQDIVDLDSELNNESSHLMLAGFFYQRTKKMLEDEQSTLEKIFGSVYNSVRRTKYSDDKKSPKTAGLGGNWSNELVKAWAYESAEYTQQLSRVTAIKYFTELLKELRSSFAVRSRSIEQLANNHRFQGRFET